MRPTALWGPPRRARRVDRTSRHRVRSRTGPGRRGQRQTPTAVEGVHASHADPSIWRGCGVAKRISARLPIGHYVRRCSFCVTANDVLMSLFVTQNLEAPVQNCVARHRQRDCGVGLSTRPYSALSRAADVMVGAVAMRCRCTAATRCAHFGYARNRQRVLRAPTAPSSLVWRDLLETEELGDGAP
jgi:hypothetical protein